MKDNFVCIDYDICLFPYEDFKTCVQYGKCCYCDNMCNTHDECDNCIHNVYLKDNEVKKYD